MKDVITRLLFAAGVVVSVSVAAFLLYVVVVFGTYLALLVVSGATLCLLALAGRLAAWVYWGFKAPGAREARMQQETWAVDDYQDGSREHLSEPPVGEEARPEIPLSPPPMGGAADVPDLTGAWEDDTPTLPSFGCWFEGTSVSPLLAILKPGYSEQEVLKRGCLALRQMQAGQESEESHTH